MMCYGAARCFCFQEASLEYGQNSLGHVLALQIVEVAPGKGQEPTVSIYLGDLLTNQTLQENVYQDDA